MPGAFTSKPWVTAEGPKLRGEYHRLSVRELLWQRTTHSGGLKQQKYILIELRSPEVQNWGAGRTVRGNPFPASLQALGSFQAPLVSLSM